MGYRNIKHPDKVWVDWFSTNAFGVDKRLRLLFRILPRDPRCKFCNAPFDGSGGLLVQVFFGTRRSELNPRFCNVCEQASRKYPGRNEVEMAMLFVGVRGSTRLSETMSPAEFSQMINRFYTSSTKLLIDGDGLAEKLAGDTVAAFWGAGFAGQNFVRRALVAAQKLSRLMARQDIPVGISVHSGVAYFGAMSTLDGLTDITASGDEVNTAARLASRAATGEIIVSEQTLRRAGVDGRDLEARSLEIKGISQPVPVRVIHRG